MATVKIFDLWVVEANTSLNMKNRCVQKYTMNGGAISPQPEGVRRPVVAQIVATIVDQDKQQFPSPQVAAVTQTNPSPVAENSFFAVSIIGAELKSNSICAQCM